jgi:hypothetical protein
LEKLAKQGIGIGKIKGGPYTFFLHPITAKFFSPFPPVSGRGFEDLLRHAAVQVPNHGFHRFCGSVRHLDSHIPVFFAFDKGGLYNPCFFHVPTRLHPIPSSQKVYAP